MDQIRTVEKIEEYRESMKMLFKEMVSDEFYETWADTFELEGVEDNQITVAYDGDEKMKKFKKECEKPLTLCIRSIVGGKPKIKFVKKSHHYDVLSPTTKRNINAAKFFLIGMVFVCIATAVVVVLCSYIGNRDFRETFYVTSSIKVDERVRVVQLSDLHGTAYGANNEKLISRVAALKPDVIICTGDMVNSAVEDADKAAALAKELAAIAPAYYVYGNNEVETIYDFALNEQELDEAFGFDAGNRDEAALLKMEDAFEKTLESTGMKVLKNEKDTIQVKGINVDVYGVLTSNPSSFWSYSEKAFMNYLWENPANLKIMAIHEPVIFEEFSPTTWGDLVLAGHTHGGVTRLPVLGPLYTHEGGILPERGGGFVYGRYNTAGSPLIVSAGLENSDVLRINNQPEIVVVDINKF